MGGQAKTAPPVVVERSQCPLVPGTSAAVDMEGEQDSNESWESFKERVRSQQEAWLDRHQDVCAGSALDNMNQPEESDGTEVVASLKPCVEQEVGVEEMMTSKPITVEDKAQEGSWMTAEDRQHTSPILLEPLSSDDEETVDDGSGPASQAFQDVGTNLDRGLIQWLSTPRRLYLRERDSERAFNFALVQAAAVVGHISSEVHLYASSPYAFQWSSDEDQLVGFVCLQDIKDVQQSDKNPSVFLITFNSNGNALRNSGGLDDGLALRALSDEDAAKYVKGLSALRKNPLDFEG